MKTNQKSNLTILIIILLSGCLGQLAADIYSPAISVIAHDLHSSISLAQTSMASYLVGMALTMVIYGVWSEGVGRRTPLITGLCLSLVGIGISLMSQDMTQLIIGRFITGLGTGAASSLWRGVFRDLYAGEQMAKYGSYLAVGIIFIIPTAPAIGGLITQTIGWRGIFAALIAYTTIVLLITHYALPETNQHRDRSKLKPSFYLKAINKVIRNRAFASVSLCVFISYGAFFSWFSAGSALLVHHLHVSPTNFGLLNFAGAGIATVCSSLINGRLVERFGSTAMLRFAWLTAASGGALMAALALLNVHTVMAAYLPAMLFYFGIAFVWPNTFAIALKPFGHMAGIAGSIYGFMQILGGGVIGLVVAHLPSTSAMPMAMLFICCPLIALLCYETLLPKVAVQPISGS